MLRDQQKPHVVTRYKGNFIFLFSSIHYLYNWYTETDTYK